MSDHDAYERYIRPNEAKLIAAAWRVLGEEQDALDALQDALTTIWKNVGQLETHPNPTAWMLRVVLNCACDRRRRRRTRRTEALSPDLAGVDASPPVVAQRGELESRLRDEIARLSPQQAQAVLLRVVEDLPYNRIAEAMGCSESTARVHVQRARQQLRSRLSDLAPSRKGAQYE